MRLRVAAYILVLLTLASGASYSQYRPRTDLLLPNFRGILKGLDEKSLLLEDEDTENALSMRVTKKTVFLIREKKAKASDFHPGMAVSVEAKRFPDGSFDAVTVRVEKPKQTQTQQ